MFSGENYEYMSINEKNIKKFETFLEKFPRKERIEFVDLNKIKFDSVRQVKRLFQIVDGNLKDLRYLTI